MLEFGPLNGPECRTGQRLSLLAQAEEGWELTVGPGWRPRPFGSELSLPYEWLLDCW